MAGQEHDHLVARLYTRRKIIHGCQDVLPCSLCLAGAVVGQESNVVFRKTGSADQQLFDGASIVARKSEALNLAGILAYSNEQRPLVVGHRRFPG